MADSEFAQYCLSQFGDKPGGCALVGADSTAFLERQIFHMEYLDLPGKPTQTRAELQAEDREMERTFRPSALPGLLDNRPSDSSKALAVYFSPVINNTILAVVLDEYVQGRSYQQATRLFAAFRTNPRVVYYLIIFRIDGEIDRVIVKTFYG